MMQDALASERVSGDFPKCGQCGCATMKIGLVRDEDGIPTAAAKCDGCAANRKTTARRYCYDTIDGLFDEI